MGEDPAELLEEMRAAEELVGSVSTFELETENFVTPGAAMAPLSAVTETTRNLLAWAAGTR
jgi:hypothetical protein